MTEYALNIPPPPDGPITSADLLTHPGIIDVIAIPSEHTINPTLLRRILGAQPTTIQLYSHFRDGIAYLTPTDFNTWYQTSGAA